MLKDLQTVRKIIMNTLKQLILVAAFVFCVTMSTSAQNNDGKKTPPKGTPPVVVVKGKEKEKPKEDKNRDNDNRGKKPQAVLFKTEDETEIDFV